MGAILGLLLLVADGLFLVPILHHEVVSINHELLVFEEDLCDSVAIDFEIEVIVGSVNFKRAGLYRVDWYLEAAFNSLACSSVVSKVGKKPLVSALRTQID